MVYPGRHIQNGSRSLFVLALLTAIQNYAKIKGAKKGKDVSRIQSGLRQRLYQVRRVEGCKDRTTEEA